jgi:lysozyme
MRLNKIQWARVTAGIVVSAAAGLATFLGFHEGTRFTPYRDPGGVWTVCTGVTGPEVIPGKRYTREECRALDEKHAASAMECVADLVTVPLTATGKVAWGSFCYSVGRENFSGSRALALLNTGRCQEACRSARENWHRGGGIPHLLDDRRADEYSMCFKACEGQ